MKNWKIAFWGKHPAFNDYLALVDDCVFIEPLIQWIELGLKTLHQQNIFLKNCHDVLRFWMVPTPRIFLCGLLITSNDKRNRPYPLLIMGQAKRSVRSELWDTFSRICKNTWSEMEQLCFREQFTFSQLQQELWRICQPQSLPRGLSSNFPRPETLRYCRNVLDIATNGHSSDSIGLTIPDGGGDYWTNIDAVQYLIKGERPQMPVSAFFDESNGSAYFYFRGLQHSDFLHLYSGERAKTNSLCTGR